jgi:hypothetical protein
MALTQGARLSADVFQFNAYPCKKHENLAQSVLNNTSNYWRVPALKTALSIKIDKSICFLFVDTDINTPTPTMPPLPYHAPTYLHKTDRKAHPPE